MKDIIFATIVLLLVFLAACGSPEPAAEADRSYIQRAYDLGVERGRFEVIMEIKRRNQELEQRHPEIDTIYTVVDSFYHAELKEYHRQPN